MKLSYNIWSYNSFPLWLPSYPLDETLRRIAHIGYDAVEIGAGSPHAWPAYLNAKRRQEIVELVHELGIEISSLCPALGGGPGLNPPSAVKEEREAAAKYTLDLIDLAADLESRIVIWLGGWAMYGTPRDEAWDWARSALRRCIPRAEEKNVTLVIESTPTDSNLFESAEDAMRMKREADSPNVKLMFDTVHALYRQEPMQDYVKMMGKDLAHIHISDRNRLPPGSGGTDFRPLIRALQDVGYSGFLTQEVGFASRDQNPDETAIKGLEYLRSLLK